MFWAIGAFCLVQVYVRLRARLLGELVNSEYVRMQTTLCR